MYTSIKDVLSRWHDGDYKYPSDTHRDDDAYELAEAYAEQYHKDDMEPITSKWIESVGGKRLPTNLGGLVMYVVSTGTIQVALDTMAGGLQVWISTRRGHEIQTSAVQVISSGCTRGDVRRLCSAVGHQLNG